MSNDPETPSEPPKFDFEAYPADTLFYDRRTFVDRRSNRVVSPTPPPPRVMVPAERRAKKERRKRIDPTTFEKQYTPDEIEFMTAMQDFKCRTGKPFPSHGEVLGVARSLGYRRPDRPDDAEAGPETFPRLVEDLA